MATADDGKPTDNIRFAKSVISCFYDLEVLNSSYVHLLKFSAEKTSYFGYVRI